MAMLLLYKRGITAHVSDVIVQGEPQYVLKETGKMFKTQKGAFNGALRWCRKQKRRPERVKKQCANVHCCMKIKPLVRPTITTFGKGEGMYFYVWETGKIYKLFANAVNNAIQYIYAFEKINKMELETLNTKENGK